MRTTRWLVPLLVVTGIGAAIPSYVRAYRVSGASDAPSFLLGDRILALKAAYDIRLPYTDIVIFSHSQPQAGDMVLFQPPGEDVSVFKRVVGCPGNTLVMEGNHLEINRVRLQYEEVNEREFQTVAARNRLGEVIERETGNGPPHLITYTGSGPHASFGPIHVPENHYFVVGDSRDNSRDSRMYGPIPRDAILGRVVRVYRPAP